jgi:hypothetical protein
MADAFVQKKKKTKQNKQKKEKDYALHIKTTDTFYKDKKFFFKIKNKNKFPMIVGSNGKYSPHR